MLVLSRRNEEVIEIQFPQEALDVLTPESIIEIHVLEIMRDRVRIGFNAPKEVPVHRREVADQIRATGSSKKST